MKPKSCWMFFGFSACFHRQPIPFWALWGIREPGWAVHWEFMPVDMETGLWLLAALDLPWLFYIRLWIWKSTLAKRNRAAEQSILLLWAQNCFFGGQTELLFMYDWYSFHIKIGKSAPTSNKIFTVSLKFGSALGTMLPVTRASISSCLAYAAESPILKKGRFEIWCSKLAVRISRVTFSVFLFFADTLKL